MLFYAGLQMTGFVKIDIPLRPVLSMPGLTYFKIAVQVSEWLSIVDECKINSSTKTIANSLRNINNWKVKQESANTSLHAPDATEKWTTLSRYWGMCWVVELQTLISSLNFLVTSIKTCLWKKSSSLFKRKRLANAQPSVCLTTATQVLFRANTKGKGKRSNPKMLWSKRYILNALIVEVKVMVSTPVNRHVNQSVLHWIIPADVVIVSTILTMSVEAGKSKMLVSSLITQHSISGRDKHPLQLIVLLCDRIRTLQASRPPLSWQGH